VEVKKTWTFDKKSTSIFLKVITPPERVTLSSGKVKNRRYFHQVTQTKSYRALPASRGRSKFLVKKIYFTSFFDRGKFMV
jgi:hypothetical protein